MKSEEFFPPILGHAGEITTIGICGNYLFTGSDDTTVRKWEITPEHHFKQLGIFGAHQHRISCIDFYDDLVVTGGYDNTLYVWNSQNFTVIAKLEVTEWVLNCKFLSATQIIFSVGHSINIWTIDQKNPDFSYQTVGGIQAIALNKTRQLLAISTYGDKKILIFDIANTQVLTSAITGDNIRKIAFDEHDYIWTLNAALIRWNLEGKVVFSIKSLDKLIDFDIFKNTVLIAKEEGSIQWFDIEQLQITKSVSCSSQISFLKKTELGYVVCTPQSHLLLLSETGEIKETIHRTANIVRSMDIKENTLLILGLNGQLKAYSVSEKSLLWELKLANATTNMISALEEQHMYVSTTTGKIIRISTENKDIKEIYDLKNMIWSAEFASPYLYLGLGSPANSVIRVDINDPLGWQNPLERRIHDNSILCIDSIDKFGILTGSLDKTITWSSFDLNKKKNVPINSPVWSVSWFVANNTPFALIGASDGFFRVYNLESDEMIVKRAHGETINSITVSPNNKLCATAGSDKQLKIWKLPELEEVATIPGQSPFLRAIWQDHILYAMEYIGRIHKIA